MKKLILLVILCAVGLMSQPTFAQVSFRANIALQPLWGPTGYDHVEYYYLPDIEAYYYVPTHQFTYMEYGHWVTRAYLPARYRNFDLYGARKIVINEPRPYMRHSLYRSRYLSARGYSRPMMIRDSHDSRYWVINGHPDHARYNNHGVNDRVIDHRGSMDNRVIDHRGTMNNRVVDHRGTMDNRNVDHRGTMDNRNVDHRSTMDNRNVDHRGTMNNDRGSVNNRNASNNNNGNANKTVVNNRGNVNNNGAANNKGNTNNRENKKDQNQK